MLDIPTNDSSINQKRKITKEELYFLRVEKGLRTNEIALYYGVTTSSIRRKLTKFGLTNLKCKKTKHSKELLEEFYIKNNLTLEQIALKLDLDERHIIKLFKRYNISLKTTKLSRKDITRDKLWFLLKEKKLTTNEIASIYNVTPGLIRKRLAKYKIYIIRSCWGDLSGLEFGMLKVLERGPNNEKSEQIWVCQCSCPKKIIKNYTTYQLVSGKATSCGCQKKSNKTNMNWTGYGEISGTVFSAIKRSAKDRNLEFNITIEYIWDLFLKQNRRCALSGFPLFFPNSQGDIGSASLDRINNKLGYIKDNVWWVDKYINIMKYNKDLTTFKKYCSAVIEINIKQNLDLIEYFI